MKQRFFGMAVVTLVALMGATQPSFAFDPPANNGGHRWSAAEQNRAKPQGLYPRDERKQKALEQLMRHDRARSAVKAGEIRSLSEIRQRVNRQFAGRIVGVELYERGGGRQNWIYDVRVLTKTGDVLAVQMDARTGNVMSVKGRR